jgi:hypothetical protein
VDVVIAGIAVIAFAMTVLVLSGAGRHLGRAPARTALDPESDAWMTIGELATMLDTPEADVMTLVDREAVPYFIVPRGNRANPADYRFRRDEIDAWIVG